MATHYSQAARRHFDDCQTLAAQQRAGNTSHLAGLAAECALKAMLQGLGILSLDNKGKPSSEQHRRHIDAIWGEYQTSLVGAEAKYAIDGINPFANWRISGRYEEDSTVDFATAEGHLSGARKAMMVLEEAQIQGDVR